MSQSIKVMFRLITIEGNEAFFNVVDPNGGVGMMTLTPGEGVEISAHGRAPLMSIGEPKR